MKILLIQPPVKDFYFTAKRSIPYGLISIASVLRQEGFEVQLIDALATSKSKIIEMPEKMSYLNEFYRYDDLSSFALFNKFRYYGYSFEHLGNLIKKSQATLVGISSLFTAYSSVAMEMARLVRKNLPESTIVVGGHHPTTMPTEVMAEPAVDFVIRGEGEVIFPQLAVALKNDCSYEGLQGLVYRNKSGEIEISPPAFMTDPDDFPLPANDLVNHKFYGRRNGSSMVIVASRGCPMKCSYCCVASPASPYRRRTVESVFAEIESGIIKQGVRFIDFEDENLTLDKRWFCALLRKIRDNYSHLELELRAMNGLFPPSIDEEMIFEMKKSGFRAVNLSLCTVSPEQLKRFNRPNVKASVEKIVGWTKKYKMAAVCYIIAGAPGQKADETIDDLIYLKNLDVVAGVSVFYPAPGSRDYLLSEKKDLLPDNLDLMRSSVIPVSDTTSRIESVTLLRLGRIVNFMKRLKDDGVLFSPADIDTTLPFDKYTKEEISLILLQAFLYDGEIRGLKSDGEVYKHNISRRLTELFLKKIR